MNERIYACDTLQAIFLRRYDRVCSFTELKYLLVQWGGIIIGHAFRIGILLGEIITTP
ncbi:hypothetical protein [Erwinia sp. HR93]|uniref:hypothetical protein n=1 Tax=Erwinia sp. HR93 TaxID=3094840 RepID=UPI002ADEAFDB|nr:hypothetical protein [Erwinia sp. HR93]MEA1062425.1 hypothetical protein [Erwinia sp. HR93]